MALFLYWSLKNKDPALLAAYAPPSEKTAWWPAGYYSYLTDVSAQERLREPTSLGARLVFPLFVASNAL